MPPLCPGFGPQSTRDGAAIISGYSSPVIQGLVQADRLVFCIAYGKSVNADWRKHACGTRRYPSEVGEFRWTCPALGALGLRAERVACSDCGSTLTVTSKNSAFQQMSTKLCLVSLGDVRTSCSLHLSGNTSPRLKFAATAIITIAWVLRCSKKLPSACLAGTEFQPKWA